MERPTTRSPFRVPMIGTRWVRSGRHPQLPPRLAALGGAGLDQLSTSFLQRAADKAGWGRQVPSDTGLGLATTFDQERGMPTWCAPVPGACESQRRRREGRAAHPRP
jgi:isoquinoline 1-oxidoreductase subunit beta